MTFQNVNGKWADNTITDKTETVADDAQIPTGVSPNTGFAGGAWNGPHTTTAINGNVSYTYTFDPDGRWGRHR